MRKLFALVFILAIAAFGQTPVTITNPQIPRVTAVGSITTVHGHGTYYYWVIANLVGGQSWPQGPFVVYQAPDILNNVQTITLNWTAVTGAINYDVLKTATSAQPATSVDCSCALATGTSSTSVVDQGQALSSYVPNPLQNATASLSVVAGTVTQPQMIIGPSGIIAVFQGGVDASAATMTAPIRLAGSDPATCDAVRHEIYYNTSTNTLRACTSTNVWSTISGSGGGGGGGYNQLQLAAVNLNQRTTLNFTGAGISCADNITNARTDCALPATVSSVAVTVPPEFAVAGSPITSNGTFAITDAAENANTVWSGPTSGGAATPGFRALVDADIPAIEVRNTRQVLAGTGLSGGGALSADVTLNVVPNTTNQQVVVLNGGTTVGTRHAINLIAGSNISYTVADNSGSDRVDVTVAATGIGYSVVQDNTGTPVTSRGTLMTVAPLTAADDSVNTRTKVSIKGLSTVGAANQIPMSDGTQWNYAGFGQGLVALSSSSIGVDTSSIPTYATGASTPVSCTAYGQIFWNTGNGSGLKQYYCNGSTYEQISGGGGGSGTVTSVGLSLPAQFSVSGSPVTTSGTLTAAWANQSVNTVFAGPSSGSATTPTFRALAPSDLPASFIVNITNEGTTGTTTSTIAKLTGAPSTAIKAATTDSIGFVGIVIAGAGTTGSAAIAVAGTAPCVFDGATTAGDYVVASGSAAGDCHDTGASMPGTNTQVLGRVLSTNAAGGTYSVTLFGPEVRAATGGGSLPGGATANQLLGENSGASGQEWKTLNGTTNQVTVTNAAGSITLALPQSINTGATVTFNQVTASANSFSPTFQNPAGSATLFNSWDTSGGTGVGGSTFRSGSATGTGATATTFLLGSDATGSGNNHKGGDLIIRPGVVGSSAGTGAGGNLQLEAPFIKGTIAASGDLMCFTADNTVGDCTTTSNTSFVGPVNDTGFKTVTVGLQGTFTVVLDGSNSNPQSAGAWVCSSSTAAAKAVPQNTACALGRQVGWLTVGVAASATTGTVLLSRQ